MGQLINIDSTYLWLVNSFYCNMSEAVRCIEIKRITWVTGN
jgi:hypothetical protein